MRSLSRTGQNSIVGNTVSRAARLKHLRVARWQEVVPATTVALLGMVAVVLATSWGIGVTPDSISYIGGARSLLAGDGFSMPGIVPTTPITHFPPLYPLLLAAGGLAGLDPVIGARWLGALMMAGNALLVGWIVARLGGNQRPVYRAFPLAAMALMLVSATMLEIHTMAWSEPVFILLGLLGFILLAQWLDGGRLSYLIFSAITLGLAFLARYAGVAYVATAVLSLVILGSRPLAKRFIVALTFGVLAALPMLVWVVRNLALAGTTTNRTLYLHIPGVSLVWEALATLSSWFLLPNALPTTVRGLAFGAIAALVGLLYLLALRNGASSSQQTGPTMLRLLALFIPIYGATLIFSNSVLRAYTPMEGRILSPLYAPLLVVVLYGCQRYLVTVRHKQLARLLFLSVGFFFIAVSLYRSAAYVRQARAEGLGFNSRMWHESDTLQQLEAFPATTTLYSNAPEAIYTHLKRAAAKMPRPVESATGLENPDYPAEFASMQREIEEGALVVLFDLPWRHVTSSAELSGALDLQPLVQARDGKIYAAEGQPNRNQP